MNPINYGKLTRIAGKIEGIAAGCNGLAAETLEVIVADIDVILRSELELMTRQEDDLK